jgi:hypothetical protein
MIVAYKKMHVPRAARYFQKLVGCNMAIIYGSKVGKKE